MGSRFVQVDLDFVDSKACGIFAARLGIDRDAAAGKMLRAWGWALAQAIKAPDGDPIRSGIIVGDTADTLISDAARWSREAAVFVQAGVEARLLARSKRGVRFMGWEDRYGAMLRKLRRDALKPDGRKSESRAGDERDSRGQIVDRRSQIVDSYTDLRIEDQEIDRNDLSAGAATSKREGVRKPSPQEQCWENVATDREMRCEEVGVDPGKPRAHKPDAINTMLNTAVESLGLEDKPQADGVFTKWAQFEQLHRRFLADEQFGCFDKEGKPRDHPWPILLFLSPNVLARYKREHDAAAGGGSVEAA